MNFKTPKKHKKYVFTRINRWKQISAFRIDFAPSIFVIKQKDSKSIGLDWFGFTITVLIKKDDNKNSTINR